MSESKPTPGPWVITPTDPCVIYAPHDPEDEPCLAITYDAESAERFEWLRNTDEAEANARLIAASPETLSTAKDVLSDCFILRDLPGIAREHADFITAHLIQPLQAAIAKAEKGESR
jgi:hypothetical protein